MRFLVSLSTILAVLATSCGPNGGTNPYADDRPCLVQTTVKAPAPIAIVPSLQIEIPSTTSQLFQCENDAKAATCEESVEQGCWLQSEDVVVGQSLELTIRFRHYIVEDSASLAEFIDETCSPSPFRIVPGVFAVEVEGDATYFHTEATIAFEPTTIGSCEATVHIESGAYNVEQKVTDEGFREILLRIKGTAVSQ